MQKICCRMCPIVSNMVMILLPPCVPHVAGQIRIWIHPSKNSCRRAVAVAGDVAGDVAIVRLSLPHSRQEHWEPRGLICAVHSSMPDKSMCQHLFLCCQFFMVFDDISPIVRPTHAAACQLQVARCQLPSYWPVLGPCSPIWLNRTWTADSGYDLAIAERFLPMLERCSLAF